MKFKTKKEGSLSLAPQNSNNFMINLCTVDTFCLTVFYRAAFCFLVIGN